MLDRDGREAVTLIFALSRRFRREQIDTIEDEQALLFANVRELTNPRFVFVSKARDLSI